MMHIILSVDASALNSCKFFHPLYIDVGTEIIFKLH
jgi:hypothetical protein